MPDGTEKPGGTERTAKKAGVGRIVVDRDFVVAEVDRRLCGSFVEHLGRVVYSGIYEPQHPGSDSNGFRTDVADLVKELGVTTVRYPGGNFVSAYDWKDGIGPRQQRPRRLDPAWHSTETNEFGLNEFMSWCQTVDIEPFLVFNLGTQGVESACQMVEYCNATGGSAMADLRKAHGRDAPYGVHLWGLGNEMDGDWQVGSRPAAEYGSLASQVARAVKRVDDSIEVVVAGSSLRAMSTFPRWDRTVLELSYDYVDYLALHQYYPANVLDEQSFAASGFDFDAYISAGIATCDYVQEIKRSKRRMNLSMDEWNVNYRGLGQWEPWAVAPAIAEFNYNCRDAVVEGSLLIALLRHADRVKVACQSLLVNVGGPIRAQRGGPAVKEAIFGPLAAVFNGVRDRSVVGSVIDSPDVATSAYGDVPGLDAVAVASDQGGNLTLFAVNRSTVDSLDLEVRFRGWDSIEAARGGLLSGSHGHSDGALVPTDVHVPAKDVGQLKMGPLSWAVLEFVLS
jgi:alpha-N-arabinofuranosidase